MIRSDTYRDFEHTNIVYSTGRIGVEFSTMDCLNGDFIGLIGKSHFMVLSIATLTN